MYESVYGGVVVLVVFGPECGDDAALHRPKGGRRGVFAGGEGIGERECVCV